MSPSQDQGIVNLLASELKLRDAKARQQINSLMAGQPDPNSIMAQNEREVENSVRQEIGQKMQARVMQERQAQARQRQALAGIAGQRASNMRMADGGIVGYAEGGPAQEEAGMLDKIKAGLGGLFGGGEKEQPAPFDVEGRVIELLRLREGADAEAKARIDQELSGFDPATVMSARQRMSQGMQAGGIVGLQEGGMPRFPRLFDFSMFLAEKGIDSLAGLSADAVNRLRQEYQAMQAREMNRPRGDSVSESQMENLGGVLRGAGNVLTEGLASLAPEPQGRNRTELADMGGAPGAGGAPQARRGPSAADLADAQAEMDILNAAQQRRNEAERAAREPQPYVLSDLAEGAGLASFFSGIPSFEEMYPADPEDASLAYKVGSATRALGTPFKVLSGFLQPKDEGQLTFSDVGPIASEFTAGLTGAEMPTQQTDVEVAENIITTAPETTTAASTEDAAAMRGVPQIANESLRRAIEGTQEAPAATQEDVVNTASAVAQNPTPENTSRFESEIQRLMERRESPIRALSSFLMAFGQARGGSTGQNLAIAATAMRAADDALDKQIVELEKLRRADQISERDFNLKQNQFDAQKDLIAAQASYYSNYQSMQENIQRIRAEQGDTAARASLLGDITTAINSEMFRYMTAAAKLLNTKDLNDPEVMKKAKELMREQINDSYTAALQQIGLAGAGSSSLGTDIRSELEAYVGQQ